MYVTAIDDFQMEFFTLDTFLDRIVYSNMHVSTTVNLPSKMHSCSRYTAYITVLILEGLSHGCMPPASLILSY